MAFSELQFPSANGIDTVWGWRVTPLGAPKACVQLIHGYGEHSRRYLHMALAFADAAAHFGPAGGQGLALFLLFLSVRVLESRRWIVSSAT